MKPWLSLIGLGEGGAADLSFEARKAVDEATLIIGGARHLALIGATKAETMAWPSPLDAAMPVLAARRDHKVAVLATGDPFFYGVGTLLMQHFEAAEMRSYPQQSAFALACNRLGWSQQDCLTISLHGRPLEAIRPLMQPEARVLALCWDGETPSRLAALLDKSGFGGSHLHVLEAMGGPRERHRLTLAAGFDLDGVQALNMVAIAMKAGQEARPLPMTAGLADDMFDHEGQITKQDLRAITLAALAPLYGQTLWDIGAGTGSIALEWMLRHPSLKAVAVEQDEHKCARIRRNAMALGAPGLAVLAGAAPVALPEGKPDAIFVGGGLNTDGLTDILMERLAQGGRLVINGVTLEAESKLFALCSGHGGRLIRITHSESGAVGGFHAMKPALPITQWRWRKP